MSLIQGASRASISENIRRESKRRPAKQAQAIAISTAVRAAKFLALDDNGLFVQGFTVDPTYSPIAQRRLHDSMLRRLKSGKAQEVRLLDQERREIGRWKLAHGKIVAAKGR